MRLSDPSDGPSSQEWNHLIVQGTNEISRLAVPGFSWLRHAAPCACGHLGSGAGDRRIEICQTRGTNFLTVR